MLTKYWNILQNLNWYNTLTKPFLTPPSWVFAPAWTILYVMIFTSLVLFLKVGGLGSLSQKVLPLTFFTLQMVLNFSWSPIFFGMHKIKLAFVVICFMWLLILATIITFYPHSKPASILLIPYFLWVSFATYLNFELMELNF